MANVTVTIGGRIMYGDGTAATSANVAAQRQPDSLTDAALATLDTASATSNASTGIFSLSVTASDTVSTMQKIKLPDGKYFYVIVPANAKSTSVGTITVASGPARGAKDITAMIPPLYWVGQDIASAATITPTCDAHNITGTTAITTVTATNYPIGKILTLVFASTPTFTDGSNLKLSANLVATADDTISIRTLDNSNFLEVARSVN